MGWIVFLCLLLILTFIGAMMGISASWRTKELERMLGLMQRQIADLRGELLHLRAKGDLAQAPKTSPPKKVKTPPVKEEPDQAETFPAEAENTPEPVAVAASAIAPPQVTMKPARTPSPLPDWAQSANASASSITGPKRNFEFELGAKWTVWVGGLALLLGAVFLLRYSIEAGFFTPGLRVIMASIMGVILLAAGEWLRRGEGLPKTADGAPIAFFEHNYIPGILTGVGIFTLLATVFSAYELYGFIGSTGAFILMGVISLSGLALGLLHGPPISALGLAAAYATPLLIKSKEPSFLGLFVFLTVVSVAAWVLARFRRWGWLALASFTGCLFWLFYTANYAFVPQNLAIWTGFFVLVFAANIWLAEDRKLLSKISQLSDFSHNGVTAMIVSGCLGVAILTLSQYSLPMSPKPAILAVAFAAALCASPHFRSLFAPHFWIVGLFALLFQIGTSQGSFQTAIAFTALLGIFGFVYYYRREKSAAEPPGIRYLKAAAAPLLPSLIMVIPVQSGINASDTTLGLIIMGIALLLAAGAYLLHRKKSEDIVSDIYVIGSALAFLIASLILFDHPWLNIAFAAGIAIYAFFYRTVQIGTARWTAFLFAAGTLYFALVITIGKFDSVSAKPFINELWIYLALPAVLSFGAGRLLRKYKKDTPSESLLALALIFAALFVLYQIRHYMQGGYIYKNGFTFEEVGLYVATGLVFTFGRRLMKIPALEPVKSKGGLPDINAITQLVPAILSFMTWITLGLFLFALCIILAPLLNPDITIVGGRFFNGLIIGYLIPVLLMGGLIWLMRKEPSNQQSTALRLFSLVGFMVYVTSQIRVFFSGASISILDKFPQGLESYVITASWLLIGVLALAIGLKFNRKSFRIGSGVIIFATVLKAFLIDMATLEGVLRAISFVILGVVLIIIGRIYQKILFKQNAEI